MTMFNDVQDFVRAANRVDNYPDLKSLLIKVNKAFGFDHVALVPHVQLVGAGHGAMDLIDYPDPWREQSRRHNYFNDDPVIAACQTSVAAFRWSELERIIRLSPRQREILLSARHCGLGDGFTVPLSVPGEFLGSCSFGTRTGRDLPEQSLPAAQYIACFAFEAARRIRTARTAVSRSGRASLSPRQYDCVVLAAQGKSDSVIGQLLGISRLTVHQHLEDAKQRYEVATRTQLVVRCLFDNQIVFGDILPHAAAGGDVPPLGE